jgi:hypothetical protein
MAPDGTGECAVRTIMNRDPAPPTRARLAGGLAYPRSKLADVVDPSTYRPASGTVPESPGVYRFRDAGGRVIYVGKAKSLRSRLNSYFADPWTLHARTQQMVTTAASVDWVTVGTEVEALQLEYAWIKEYDPRFNVRYRDDKSYPFLAVTLDEEYPRFTVMRGAKRRVPYIIRSFDKKSRRCAVGHDKIRQSGSGDSGKILYYEGAVEDIAGAQCVDRIHGKHRNEHKKICITIRRGRRGPCQAQRVGRAIERDRHEISRAVL